MAARAQPLPSSRGTLAAKASSNWPNQSHLATGLALVALANPFELHHVSCDDALHEVAAVLDMMNVERNRVAVERAVVDQEDAFRFVAGTADDAPHFVGVAKFERHILLRGATGRYPSAIELRHHGRSRAFHRRDQCSISTHALQC